MASKSVMVYVCILALFAYISPTAEAEVLSNADAYAWGEITVNGTWLHGPNKSGSASASADWDSDYAGQGSGWESFDLTAEAEAPDGYAFADANSLLDFSVGDNAPHLMVGSSADVETEGDLPLYALGEAHAYGEFTATANGYVTVEMSWGWSCHLDEAVDLPHPEYPEDCPSAHVDLLLDFSILGGGSMRTLENGYLPHLGTSVLHDWNTVGLYGGAPYRTRTWTVLVHAMTTYVVTIQSSTGASAAVPEPATLSLLALGGLGLIRRRRVA